MLTPQIVPDSHAVCGLRPHFVVVGLHMLISEQQNLPLAGMTCTCSRSVKAYFHFPIL